MSEAAAQQRAIQAAAEAAEQSDFVRLSDNMQGDAQAQCALPALAPATLATCPICCVVPS
jgi:hypothetical protein